MTVERSFETFVEQEAERDVEPGYEWDGRREGRVQLRLRLARLLPVVVEARRGAESRIRVLGDRHHGEPGRGHERLLRAGGDDVEAPQVGLERNGAEAGDAVDDNEGAGLLRDGSERLDVGDDAGRGLGVREEDDLRAVDAAAQILGV